MQSQEKSNYSNNKEITFIITSCGRLNLLFRTIDSFLKFNTYPIKEYIIIEDSSEIKNIAKIKERYGDLFTYIFNEKNLGMINSIAKVYSAVKTDYVFHCEDDWEFYRHGFIEDSMLLIEHDPKINFISLRNIYHEYMIHHPKAHFGETEYTSGIPYRKLFSEHRPTSYSSNPHLFYIDKTKRKLLDFSKWAKHEADVKDKYNELGYYGVVLENSACAHIGWGASLFNQRRKRIDVKLKNLIKAMLNVLGKDYTFEQ